MPESVLTLRNVVRSLLRVVPVWAVVSLAFVTSNAEELVLPTLAVLSPLIPLAFVEWWGAGRFQGRWGGARSLLVVLAVAALAGVAARTQYAYSVALIGSGGSVDEALVAAVAWVRSPTDWFFLVVAVGPVAAVTHMQMRPESRSRWWVALLLLALFLVVLGQYLIEGHLGAVVFLCGLYWLVVVGALEGYGDFVDRLLELVWSKEAVPDA